MLRAIRAAGFAHVGFEEFGLEVDGDRLEGDFHVKPLNELCSEHDEGDAENDWDSEPLDP